MSSPGAVVITMPPVLMAVGVISGADLFAFKEKVRLDYWRKRSRNAGRKGAHPNRIGSPFGSPKAATSRLRRRNLRRSARVHRARRRKLG